MADGTIKIVTELDTEKVKKGLLDLKNTTTSSAKNISSSFQDANKNIISFGQILKANIISDIVIGAVKKTINLVQDFGMTLIETSANVDAESAQFSATFNELQEDATKAIGRVSEETGVLDDRLKILATQGFSQFKGAGVEANKSLEITETFMKMAADAAAYYDISIEDASVRLRSFLRGNTEAGDAIGLFTSEGQRNAKAVELMGDKYTKLTEAQKQMVMLEISKEIYEQNGAVGQAAREADGWVNVQGNLSEAWRQFIAILGTPVLEAITPIVQGITKGIKNLLNSVKESDNIFLSISEHISSIFPQLEPLITEIANIFTNLGESIGNFFSNLTSNIDLNLQTAIEIITPFISNASNLFNELMEFIVPIGGAILEAFGEGALVAVELLSGAMGFLAENFDILEPIIVGIVAAIALYEGSLAAVSLAIKIVTIAQTAFNALMAVNPFTVLILGITAAVAGLLYLWNTNEDFRNAIINIWETIKETAENVWGTIVKFFKEDIPNAIETAIEWFEELPEKIKDAIDNAIETVETWVNNLIEIATTEIPKIINAIIKFFEELPYKIGYAIGFVIGTIVKWALDLIETVKTEVPKIIDNIINFFKELPDKIYNAIIIVRDKVVQWGTSVYETAKAQVTKIVNSIVNFFKELPEKIYNAIIGAKDKVVQWGTELISSGKEKISEFSTTVLDAIKDLPEKFLETGRNIVDALVRGVQQKIEGAKNNITGFFTGIADGVKGVFKISSPSKLFRDEIGAMLPEGLALGVKDGIPKVERAATEMADKTFKAATSWIDNYRTSVDYLAEEEIEMWRFLGERYEDSQEYKAEIDKRLNDLQKSNIEEQIQIEDEAYKHSMDWIEKKKEAGELSLEQELAAYERVQSRYKEGSEERKEIDKELLEFQKRITEDFADSTIENIQKASVIGLGEWSDFHQGMEEISESSGLKILQTELSNLEEQIKSTEQKNKEITKAEEIADKERARDKAKNSEERLKAQQELNKLLAQNDLESLKERQKILEEQKKQLLDAYNELSSGIISALKAQYTEQRDLAKDTLSREVSLRKEALESLKESNKEALESQADAQKESLEKQVKASKEALDSQVEAQKIATSEIIEQYKKEYEAKIKTLDIEELGEVSAIQSQIDAIDAQTEAEERALKEQANQKKLFDLQSKIQQAKTEEERISAQEQYNEEFAKQQRDALLLQRKDEKASLKEQITEIKNSYKERKETAKEDFETKKVQAKDEEELQLNHLKAQKQMIEDDYQERKKILEKDIKERKKALEDDYKQRKQALDEYNKSQSEMIEDQYKSLTAKARLEAEARQLMVDNDQKAIVELLNKYVPEWGEAGKNAGEALLNNLQSVVPGIEATVKHIMGLIGQTQSVGSGIQAIPQEGLSEIASATSEPIPNPYGIMQTLASNTIGNIKTSMEDSFSGVSSWKRNLFSSMPSFSTNDIQRQLKNISSPESTLNLKSLFDFKPANTQDNNISKGINITQYNSFGDISSDIDIAMIERRIGESTARELRSRGIVY